MIIICHRYVLDGDREELRGIRSELSALRAMRQPHPKSSGRAEPSCQTTEKILVSGGHESGSYGDSGNDGVRKNSGDVLQQLLTERKELLSTGLYDAKDDLIVELDQSILKLKAKIAEQE